MLEKEQMHKWKGNKWNSHADRSLELRAQSLFTGQVPTGEAEWQAEQMLAEPRMKLELAWLLFIYLF